MKKALGIILICSILMTVGQGYTPVIAVVDYMVNETETETETEVSSPTGLNTVTDTQETVPDQVADFWTQPDIHPTLNPASDNWLTKAVIKERGIATLNLTNITQADFDAITSLNLKGSIPDDFWEAVPKEYANLRNLKTLTLSSNFDGSKRIPESLFELPSLREVSFSKYTGARFLDELCGGSQIESISVIDSNAAYNKQDRRMVVPDAIENLQNLQNLTIEYAGQIDFPAELGQLINLKSFNVSTYSSHEGVKGIIPNEIGNLTNLETISLNYMSLETLPEEINNCVSLKTISLIDNNFISLPLDFTKLKNIESINLYENRQLMTLPDSIGSLDKLDRLNLEYTALTTLPESIGNCTALKTLTMNYVLIKVLPDSFVNLVNLETLEMKYNTELRSLPENIGNLSKLTSLELICDKDAGGQLERLPESFTNLTKLTNLNLSGHKIKVLPASLGNMKLLNSITMNNNQLENLPESIGNLPNLTAITIKNNQLRALPSSLINLEKLGLLEVPGNQLSAFPLGTLKWAVFFRLDLSNNKFTEFPDLSGFASKSIRSVDLSSNQISSLGTYNSSSTLAGFLTNQTKLESLSLDGNKISAINPDWIGKIGSNVSIKNQALSVNSAYDAAKKTATFVNPIKYMNRPYSDEFSTKIISNNGSYKADSNWFVWTNAQIQDNYTVQFKYLDSANGRILFSGTITTTVTNSPAPTPTPTKSPTPTSQPTPTTTTKPTPTITPTLKPTPTVTPTPKIVAVSAVKTQSVVYVVKGKSVKLPVVIKPFNATNPRVMWSSANKKIATVTTKGTVKGVKVGKTTIMVKSIESGKFSKCTVYVVAKTSTLKGITISPSATKKLVVGKTFAIKTKLNPVKATGIIPNYKSSNTKIATVDALGNVTAIKPGKTVVTVKAGKYSKRIPIIVVSKLF